MGGRSIACLNARDRNLLGFQRDLLTAAAYGVDQFLLVRGDEPRVGGRTSELTVRTMLAEARVLRSLTAHLAEDRDVRLGAVAGLGSLPAWKREADFLFVQVGFSARGPAALARAGAADECRLCRRDRAGQLRRWHGAWRGRSQPLRFRAQLVEQVDRDPRGGHRRRLRAGDGDHGTRSCSRACT